jgi:hypothetical protein
MFGFGQAMTLRTVLSLANEQFLKAIDDSERKMTGFQKAMKAHSAAFISAGTAIIGTVTGMVAQGVAYGSTINDIAVATGVATEDVGRLGYALEQSGGSIRDLVPALRGLSNNLYEAVNKGAGPAYDAFKRLGVSMKDASGRVRPATELLPDLASALSGVTNETERLAIAQDAMGKGAANMLPLLGQGGAAMREMMRRAEELGMALDAKTIAQLDATGDALENIQKAIRGMAMRLAADLGPAIEKAANKVADLVAKFKELPPSMRRTVEGTALIGASVGVLAPWLLSITILLERLWKWRTALGGLLITLGIVGESVGLVTGLVFGLNEAQEEAYDVGLRNADGRLIALGNALGYAKNYMLTMGDATRAWMMTLRDTLPLADELAEKTSKPMPVDDAAFYTALENLGLPPPIPYRIPEPPPQVPYRYKSDGATGGATGGAAGLPAPELSLYETVPTFGENWDDYFESFAVGVRTHRDELGGLVTDTADAFDSMSRLTEDSVSAWDEFWVHLKDAMLEGGISIEGFFEQVGNAAYQAVVEHGHFLKTFGQNIVRTWGQIILAYGRQQVIEIAMTKITELTKAGMKAWLNPSILLKIAGITAAAAAGVAAISALAGQASITKFHGGGFPREALATVRPQREVVVDVPTAMRGGFGAGMLGGLGGTRVDVSVNILRAEMTDPELDGRRLGDAIARQLTLAMARG